MGIQDTVPLSSNEETEFIKKENERRRKLRLLQVREQEKLYALQLRERAKQLQKQNQDEYVEKCKDEWETQKQIKVTETKESLSQVLDSIGKAQQRAILESQQKQKQQQEEFQNAVVRHQTETERFEKAQEYIKQAKMNEVIDDVVRLQRMAQVLENEKIRSKEKVEQQKIHAKNQEKEKEREKDEIKRIEGMGKIHKKQFSASLFTNTRFHQPTVIKHSSPTSKLENASSSEIFVEIENTKPSSFEAAEIEIQKQEEVELKKERERGNQEKLKKQRAKKAAAKLAMQKEETEIKRQLEEIDKKEREQKVKEIVSTATFVEWKARQGENLSQPNQGSELEMDENGLWGVAWSNIARDANDPKIRAKKVNKMNRDFEDIYNNEDYEHFQNAAVNVGFQNAIQDIGDLGIENESDYNYFGVKIDRNRKKENRAKTVELHHIPFSRGSQKDFDWRKGLEVESENAQIQNSHQLNERQQALRKTKDVENRVVKPTIELQPTKNIDEKSPIKIKVEKEKKAWEEEKTVSTQQPQKTVKSFEKEKEVSEEKDNNDISEWDSRVDEIIKHDRSIRMEQGNNVAKKDFVLQPDFASPKDKKPKKNLRFNLESESDDKENLFNQERASSNILSAPPTAISMEPSKMEPTQDLAWLKEIEERLRKQREQDAYDDFKEIPQKEIQPPKKEIQKHEEKTEHKETQSLIHILTSSIEAKTTTTTTSPSQNQKSSILNPNPNPNPNPNLNTTTKISGFVNSEYLLDFEKRMNDLENKLQEELARHKTNQIPPKIEQTKDIPLPPKSTIPTPPNTNKQDQTFSDFDRHNQVDHSFSISPLSTSSVFSPSPPHSSDSSLNYSNTSSLPPFTPQANNTHQNSPNTSRSFSNFDTILSPTITASKRTPLLEIEKPSLDFTHTTHTTNKPNSENQNSNNENSQHNNPLYQTSHKNTTLQPIYSHQQFTQISNTLNEDSSFETQSHKIFPTEYSDDDDFDNIETIPQTIPQPTQQPLPPNSPNSDIEINENDHQTTSELETEIETESDEIESQSLSLQDYFLHNKPKLAHRIETRKSFKTHDSNSESDNDNNTNNKNNNNTNNNDNIDNIKHHTQLHGFQHSLFPASQNKMSPPNNQPVSLLERLSRNSPTKISKSEMFSLNHRNYQKLPEVIKKQEETKKRNDILVRQERVKQLDLLRREKMAKRK